VVPAIILGFPAFGHISPVRWFISFGESRSRKVSGNIILWEEAEEIQRYDPGCASGQLPAPGFRSEWNF
jgi:hypothetical protein